MKPALIALALLALAGCGGQKRANAELAANMYAAAQAAQEGKDLDATQTAIRLQAEEIANRNGFTIHGASEWKASLCPKSPPESP